jgi:hypothetical protein
MLFLKSKKTSAAEPSTSNIANREPRYGSIALVSVNGYEGMAVLRNVSQSGFRLESKTFVEMELGSIFTMKITPETSSGIKQFEVEVETRWILCTQEKFSAGFLVVQGGNRSFQKYVDFHKSNSRII